MSGHQYQSSQDRQQDTEQEEGEQVNRGGRTHKVVRGDTLSKISIQTYGLARYWRNIAEANPSKVHQGGDVIVVGDELTLPAINVPAQTAPEVAEATPVAVEPDYRYSDYGSFIVYPDNYTGEKLEEPDHQTVSESEYVAIFAARKAAAQSQQVAAEAQANRLLSTDLWSGDVMITDAEATEALHRLSALPYAERKAACTNLGEAKVRTLLEEVPAAVRDSNEWYRVLFALDAKLVLPHIQTLLSTGWFSSISDAELAQVANIIGRMTGEQALALFHQLDATVRRRLLVSLPRGVALTADQRRLLSSLFYASTDVEEKSMLMGQYFDIEIGPGQFNAADKNEGIDWTAEGLERVFWVLDALPPAHVAGNDEVDTLWRYQKRAANQRSSTSGGFYRGPTSDLVALNYQDLDAENESEEGDPLNGVTRFDKVVRHEIGHAVDDRIGAENTICKSAIAGEWVTYRDDYATVAEGMIVDSGSAIDGLSAAQRAEVKTQIEDWMTSRKKSGYADALATEMSFWGTLDEATQNALKADPVWIALEKAFNKPWYNEGGGGTCLDERVYQESYANKWTSYKPGVRAKKVSEYQFRAPGEWFAEVYACYYEDGTGELLNSRDSAAKDWFDDHVATIANATP